MAGGMPKRPLWNGDHGDRDMNQHQVRGGSARDLGCLDDDGLQQPSIQKSLRPPPPR